MLNIAECPGLILTYFTGSVGILVGMIIPLFIWWSPKGHCYGNQLNLEDVHRHRQERSLLFTSKYSQNTESTNIEQRSTNQCVSYSDTKVMSYQ